jgi:hypothetical protein
MKRVFICSPYRGDRDRNADYLEAAITDSLGRGEAPFAPHGLYPQWLDDDDLSQRELGIACGLAFLNVCDLIAIYTDLGMSEGMRAEERYATMIGTPIEYRSAGAPWKET